LDGFVCREPIMLIQAAFGTSKIFSIACIVKQLPLKLFFLMKNHEKKTCFQNGLVLKAILLSFEQSLRKKT
jgi:hypothetical protein